MFSHNGKISARQVQILLILQMLNMTMLVLPKLAATYIGRDGYILPILAIVIGLIYVYSILYLTNKFPNETIVEFAPKIVPKLVSDIILILFVIKILISTGLELRMIGEMVSQVLLPKTPLSVIILVFLLTVSYLVKSGLEATARMAEVLIYFIFIPLGIVVLNVVTKADYKQLMPFFQFEGKDLIKGTYFISLTFTPLEFMLIITGLMRKPKESYRSAIVAIVVVAVIEAGIIILTYTGVGVEESQRQIWPVLMLMQSVQLAKGSLENQEIFMMTVWIFSVFMYISSGVYFSSIIPSKSMHLKRENIFVLPFIPLVYFVAVMPKSLIQTYNYYIGFERYLGIYFLLPIPLILALISNVRRREDEN